MTYQGQPVAVGKIRFSAKPGTSAPLIDEQITDGRYATTKSGGLPVGQYHVEIRSYDPDAPPRKYMSDPAPAQLLPAKHNTKSKMEFTVESGQGDITKDFELTD